MSSPPAVYHEIPFFFPCGHDDLFGILTVPDGHANGVTALSLWGSGAIPSFGQGHVRRDLARRLAALGYCSLRLDYVGCGESTGDLSRGHRLDAPSTDEVVAATHWLARHGLSRLLLIGSCFGARTTLAAADQLPGLEGVALLSAPVWDDERQVAAALGAQQQGGAGRSDPAGQAFLRQVDGVVARGVPLLFVYGDGDHAYRTFRLAIGGALGDLVRRGGEFVALRVINGSVHGYPTVAIQESVVAAVGDWACGIGGASPVGDSGCVGRSRERWR